MVNIEDIVKLYSIVFNKEKDQFKVHPRQILNGIKEIAEAYLPDPKWEAKQKGPSTYYEDAGHRCAYLHKYAMIHTALLCELLEQVLKVYSLKEVMDTDCLNLCSLGSGPGTDIVSCLLVLKEKFGPMQILATLIDCCDGWKSVFEAIVSELKSNNFRHVNGLVSEDNFHYEHIAQDLLDPDALKQTRGITGADVLTMVKFVSAAACKDTRKMVKSLFYAMKPGALLLFVDNAAGGFWELMSETAKECGMESVFGPLRHYEFKEEAFCRDYCGCKSQYEAKVAVEIWKKPEFSAWNTTEVLRGQFFSQARTLAANFRPEDFPAIDAVDSHGPVIGKAPWPYVRETEDEIIELQSARPSFENVSETESNRNCCTIM